MFNFSSRAFVALFVFLSVTSVFAHNKVVVIPMDDLRTIYEIGKTGPAGGIVFHVTDGGLHGLEASHEDQGTAEWGCFETDLTLPNIISAATPDPNTGAYNTQQIIVNECGTSSAAVVARDYEGPNGITTGWYLPNKDELDLLYDAKVNGTVGGFASNDYWSSSEIGSNVAWSQNFGNGSQSYRTKFGPVVVRAVRAF